MIAIVGMACQYPDADSPRALWENVLACRRAFRRFPKERLDLDDYFSADRTLADAIYVTEGAFIEGYEFDRVKFRVAGPTYRSADLVHWLALDVAARALEDSGLEQHGGLPAESTGVILGNTLTGEFSRAGLMRLRWPYVRRVVGERLHAQGWDTERRGAFLADLEGYYKSPFEPTGEETLAGGLSNTIAGRICNHFNLQGGGFTIDGACSSSLLAIAQACQALRSGDLDVALAGGVDLSLDPFELIGFAKTGALATGEMRVYDVDSGGFLPGEGCGFLVLMRHEDALERGLRCYALIRGCGISSDGGGGITRPEVSGQLLALRRAYRQAGYAPDSVRLFEGHGTGTAVGDEVELTALKELLGASREPAYVGSVKANIGHTKAAAGAAGMLKAIMALHAQLLPPATGVRKPHRLLESGPLGILEQGRGWPEGRLLRAGVSSFGFGGINVHIALESPMAHHRKKLTAHEQALVSSSQDAEVFLFGAEDRQELLAKIGQVSARAGGLSLAELADVAAWLASSCQGQASRAAVVAANPKELKERLALLESWLAKGECRKIDAEAGVFLGCGKLNPKIVYLFPGQAAPVRCNGGAMARRYEAVRTIYRLAELPQAGDTIATAIAQPAIVAAELAGLRLLDRLGLKAGCAVGHSLGELTALHWAGAMDAETLLRLVKQRGQAMGSGPEGEGAMASIAADEATVSRLLEGQHEVVIAGINSPRQTVISGEAQTVSRLIAKADSQRLRAVHLPVSHGFHSPLMQTAAQQFGEILREEHFKPLRHSVISTVTGGALAEHENLQALLEKQLTQPVRFIEALHSALAEADLCLEVGPGEILSGLVRASSSVPSIPLDSAGGSLQGLLLGLGAAYALGAEIDSTALLDGRFTRPFDPALAPRFFANPCESAPKGETGFTVAIKVQPTSPAADKSEEAPPAADGQADILSVIRELVARKAELPLSAVQDDHHLLRDLHLNSISVGQIIAETSRRLNLPPPLSPTEFANATLAQAAAALEQSRAVGLNGNPMEKEFVPSGIDAWVMAFGVEKMQRPLSSQPRRKPQATGHWRLFAPPQHPWADPLHEALEALGGEGVLLCLPPETSEGHDALLLAAAHACLERDGFPRSFVVVQHGGVAGSFVRTLYLEARELDACVIDTPYTGEAVDWACREALEVNGFHEAVYDAEGRRWEPALRPFYMGRSPTTLPLTAKDVLLVSGGGKGIAAESALALAKETGVKLLLLGRANPETDPELAGNLERFKAAGVVFCYRRADVTDAEAVKTAVQGAGESYAPVTAILHGAGINQPCALSGLNLSAMAATQRPKTQGLANLLAAVDTQGLRLLVAFGSVIGRIGLHGEADYALANARLSRMVEAFQTDHPHCHCLSLEWSIWSGVGMGERLGRVDALLQEGITPITPDQGMDWLRRLIAAPGPSASVVVSGRLGATPPMRLASGGELPFLRFLEHPRVHYPGVELVADVEISSVSDPYLEDHVFRGERLLPAVLGLEAMAQAAFALTHSATEPGFESVEFNHPIVVDAGKSIHVRIVALQREQGRIEVALRCSQTAFQIDHFRGICVYQNAEQASLSGPLFEPSANLPSRIRLRPGQDLYGKLLFHTGRFRRVLAYWELGAFHCLADIAKDDGSPWFARYLPPGLALGDPGSRDAAIHAIQACIPHGTILPIGLDKLIPGDLHTPGPWTIHARERWQRGDVFCHDLEIRGADSTLRERWEGLRLRRVAALPHDDWADPLLLAYLERRIRELTGRSGLGITLERGSENNRQDRAERALHRLVGANAQTGRRPDGKPEAEGEKTVSVAHSADLTVAVAGPAPLACDLEEVVKREPQVWDDLLGEQRKPLARLIAQQTGESFDLAATRVWASMECLIKSGLPPNVPLTLAGETEDGGLLIGAGKTTIATFLLDSEAQNQTRILALLAGSEANDGSS